MNGVHIELDVPGDLARFKLPAAVHRRLQALLDRQDAGEDLSEEELAEAQGLVDLVELISLLKLRAERAQRVSLDPG